MESQLSGNPPAVGDPQRLGLLYAFEGIDGSGKSTQAQRLFSFLQEKGQDVILSCEPTNGPYGRQLREKWLAGVRHSPDHELELFLHDRQEHVKKLIIPGLLQSRVVIIDRYFYSSIAYQGVRGEKKPGEIHRMMTRFAPTPDLTLIFDLDVETAIRRMTSSRNDEPNRLELRENLVAVKAAFDAMVYAEIVRIDASLDPDSVFKKVLTSVQPTLGLRGIKIDL